MQIDILWKDGNITRIKDGTLLTINMTGGIEILYNINRGADTGRLNLTPDTVRRVSLKGNVLAELRDGGHVIKDFVTNVSSIRLPQRGVVQLRRGMRGSRNCTANDCKAIYLKDRNGYDYV
jgi:hypothetical protein